MTKTTLCVECGVDTDYRGFVNRIPSSHDDVDGYLCGSCVSIFESEDSVEEAD